MLLYTLSGSALAILGTIYFSYFIYRLLKQYTKLDINKIIMVGIVLIIGFISYFARNFFSLYTTVYAHLLIISVLFELLHTYLKKYKGYHFLFTTGILSIVTTLLVFVYGFYNMQNLVKTSYQLISDKTDTLTILQITDLHMSTSVSIEMLEEYCEEMSSIQPDIVVLTGDIFDENTPRKDMQEASKLLGSIDNTLGIYYVYGNHDRNLYTWDPNYTEEDMRDNLTKNNITILDDEIIELNQVTLIGRLDASFNNENYTRKTMSKLLSDVNSDTYSIVLDHQPLELAENAELGIDLQLSGHTHGGQLFPSRYIEELLKGNLVYGQRSIGDFTAITSSGISGWGYPIKTGAPSEYVVVTINP